ncbi:CGI-121-domain-containing protein [Tilletiaria anomala UBC 951]|uniref:EKC/KEOPS complex subunit CGI121 n=1 Tax=Tilletiaria anomala (strain ATCC 24038 / CBS 436.72 / UBC 951) TaxID=1037660 RepID=A0A066WRB8_TILAU|nr:CGI-121-domain-containing protein [Tilletiaria anomala UBC 951]KDN53200.1 CGI-121-domain-containing protein [Tilletiaria anomala UBC 951]
METYSFPHMPEALQDVHIALFRSITCGAKLRQRLISAAAMPADAAGDAEREAVNFAFIDAAMILSLQQLLTAVHQALLIASRGSASEGVQGGMRTASIHGEIIFALHPANNIGEALRNFGVGPQTKDLLIIRVSASESTSGSTFKKSLLEQMVSLAQQKPDTQGLVQSLSANTDVDKIRKAYKLSNTSLGAEVKGSDSALEELVVSTIAMKSVAG